MRCADSKRLRKRVLIQRGGRGAPVHWEWHNYPSALYLMAGIAHSRRHARWSTTVYVYLPAWLERTPLGRVPSTGWRAWGSTWAPVNPWRGGSRPWARRNHR